HLGLAEAVVDIARRREQLNVPREDGERLRQLVLGKITVAETVHLRLAEKQPGKLRRLRLGVFRLRRLEARRVDRLLEEVGQRAVLQFNQLDLEAQCRLRRDGAALLVAVRQFGRDDERRLVADVQQREALVPALDDLLAAKREREG